MNDIVQISTTLDSRERADQLAATLVGEQWAACVQVHGPITSCYRWQGKIETAQEWVCTVKTRRDLLEPTVARIGQVHPYDEPEIIATGIVGGSTGYQRWVDESVRAPSEGKPLD